MRSLLLVVVAVVMGCGSTQKSTTKKGPLTARDIIDSSSPAIVRIEAGEAKVGTGFIIGNDGLIATNLHVIEGESNIKVKLYKNPVEYPATVIAGLTRVTTSPCSASTRRRPYRHCASATRAPSRPVTASTRSATRSASSTTRSRTV